MQRLSGATPGKPWQAPHHSASQSRAAACTRRGPLQAGKAGSMCQPDAGTACRGAISITGLVGAPNRPWLAARSCDACRLTPKQSWRSAGSGESCQRILSRPGSTPDQAAEASICRDVGRSLSESRCARISSARRSLYAATAVTATRHSFARSLACTQCPDCHRRPFTGYLEPCLCPCGLLLRPCMCPLMMTLVRHAFAGLCRRQVHTIAHTLQDPHGILCSLECRAACACKACTGAHSAVTHVRQAAATLIAHAHGQRAREGLLASEGHRHAHQPHCCTLWRTLQ